MKIMYIVVLLSFAALAGAAYAITRHIRKNAAASQGNPARELEMSQALDVRLTGISRPAGSNAKVEAAPTSQSGSVVVESPSEEEPPDDELRSDYQTSKVRPSDRH